MAKDFSGFLEHLETLDRQEIQDSIIMELNEYADKNNIPEDERFIWNLRSFNSKLTMRYLEEYHKWLHD